jgi:hypothetical protein
LAVANPFQYPHFLHNFRHVEASGGLLLGAPGYRDKALLGLGGGGNMVHGNIGEEGANKTEQYKITRH